MSQQSNGSSTAFFFLGLLVAIALFSIGATQAIRAFLKG